MGKNILTKENRMIPKKIYSTWISDKPTPEKYNKFIASWAKVMPDYSVKIISLENVKLSPFVSKCIAEKKFALAGHYARVQELYDNGGIYFDIDIEAVKPLDKFLNESFVLGIEDEFVVNNAVIISEKGHPLLKKMLDFMDGFDIENKDAELETGPRMVTKLMAEYGWEQGHYGRFKDILITRPEVFYPYHYTEILDRQQHITHETFTIHHWSISWGDLVSIIIPCYNQGKFLSDAINSAINQTYGNTEIIVVNDGSTDNTHEIAKGYGDRITYIEQTNKGLSAARNTGIKASKGKWIVPLDADDKIHHQYIQETVGKSDIVSTWLQCFGKSTQVWKPKGISPTYKDFLKSNHIFCCSIFRKEIWEKVGGYDEEQFVRGKQGVNGYEDWSYWIKCTKAGAKVTVIPKVLFFYRKHEHSMHSEAIKNHAKIIRYMKSVYGVNEQLNHY